MAKTMWFLSPYEEYLLDEMIDVDICEGMHPDLLEDVDEDDE